MFRGSIRTLAARSFAVLSALCLCACQATTNGSKPSPSPASASLQSCGTVGHGMTVTRTRYRYPTARAGQACESEIETRKCVNGNFTTWTSVHNYGYDLCESLASCVPPNEAPENFADRYRENGVVRPIPSGGLLSRVRYSTESVAFGVDCPYIIQTSVCNGPDWSAWAPTGDGRTAQVYSRTTCTTLPGSACMVPSGVACTNTAGATVTSIAHGANLRCVRYQRPQAQIGETCAQLAETQTGECWNGTLRNWAPNAATYGTCTAVSASGISRVALDIDNYLITGYVNGTAVFNRSIESGSTSATNVLAFAAPTTQEKMKLRLFDLNGLSEMPRINTGLTTESADNPDQFLTVGNYLYFTAFNEGGVRTFYRLGSALGQPETLIASTRNDAQAESNYTFDNFTVAGTSGGTFIFFSMKNRNDPQADLYYYNTSSELSPQKLTNRLATPFRTSPTQLTVAVTATGNKTKLFFSAIKDAGPTLPAVPTRGLFWLDVNSAMNVDSATEVKLDLTETVGRNQNSYTDGRLLQATVLGAIGSSVLVRGVFWHTSQTSRPVEDFWVRVTESANLSLQKVTGLPLQMSRAVVIGSQLVFFGFANGQLQAWNISALGASPTAGPAIGAASVAFPFTSYRKNYFVTSASTIYIPGPATDAAGNFISLYRYIVPSAVTQIIPGSAQLTSPDHVAVAPDGSVYFSAVLRTDSRVPIVGRRLFRFRPQQ